MDARHEALLPKEVSTRMAHEQTFRIYHRQGSVIVMAKSETDKAVWLSALEHQVKLRKSAHIGTVTASNRIVHEVIGRRWVGVTADGRLWHHVPTDSISTIDC